VNSIFNRRAQSTSRNVEWTTNKHQDGKHQPKRRRFIYNCLEILVFRRFFEAGQFSSIRRTGRLAEAEVGRSDSSTGDSYSNAVTGSIIGLLRTRNILAVGPLGRPRQGRMRGAGQVLQQAAIRADRQNPAGRDYGNLLRSGK
jgi:hypothetical protein